MSEVPEDLPRWATDVGAEIVEPIEAKKDSGWAREGPLDLPERPPFQEFNWWQNNVFDWAVHIEGFSQDMDAEFLFVQESSPQALTVEVSAGRISHGDSNIDFAAATSPTFSAADPTDARIDLLTVDNTGTLQIIVGVPAPSSMPLPHTGFLVIAEITIPALATVITNADIKDVRPWIILSDESVGLITRQSMPPDFAVDVSEGLVTYGDKLIKFAGATSGAFAAADPTDDRVDLLFIDEVGVLQIVTGTAEPSPISPPHTGLLTIAEITVRATATTILDPDIQDARPRVNAVAEDVVVTPSNPHALTVEVGTRDVTYGDKTIRFPGGTSPAFSAANTLNDRIDVLFIDDSGVLQILEGDVPLTFLIFGIVVATKTIELDDDQTKKFSPGQTVQITNSAQGNNGTYTIDTVGFSAGETQIVVVEVLPGSDEGGGNLTIIVALPVVPIYTGVLTLAEITIRKTSTEILVSDISDIRPKLNAELGNLVVRQSRPTALTVAISSGRATFGTKSIEFAGGPSPVFPTPDPNDNRIDLVHIDDTGTILIDAGTADVSPVPNSHEGKLVLAEVTVRGNADKVVDSDIKDARSFLQPSISQSTLEQDVLSVDQELPIAGAIEDLGVDVVVNEGTYLAVGVFLFELQSANIDVGVTGYINSVPIVREVFPNGTGATSDREVMSTGMTVITVISPGTNIRLKANSDGGPNPPHRVLQNFTTLTVVRIS